MYIGIDCNLLLHTAIISIFKLCNKAMGFGAAATTVAEHPHRPPPPPKTSNKYSPIALNYGFSCMFHFDIPIH